MGLHAYDGHNHASDPADREAFHVGQELYGLPGHICPTVALHEEAIIVRDGRATDERWAVAARKRKVTI